MTYFKRHVIITIRLDQMPPNRNREICIMLFQQVTHDKIQCKTQHFKKDTPITT